MESSVTTYSFSFPGKVWRQLGHGQGGELGLKSVPLFGRDGQRSDSTFVPARTRLHLVDAGPESNPRRWVERYQSST